MKKYLTTLLAAALSAAVLLVAVPAAAQVANPTLEGEACRGITGSTSPTGTGATACADPGFFGGLVESVLNILSIVLGGIAAIVLVVAGIMYVASGGDPNNTKRAKDAILYAVIGIVVAVAAQGIVRFVIGNV